MRIDLYELASSLGNSARTVPTRVITADHLADEAMADLTEGLRKHEIWISLAFHEIRQRFRRSILGPFWLTLSMGVMVAALGLVFSTLFSQDIGQTLPYIAVGLIFWGLLTSTINEGATAFIGNEGYIRNVPLPLSVHYYRVVARNLVICAFNMAIYMAVLAWFRIVPSWQFLLAIPGFALFIINASWMGLAAGILSTRYRDIPQVIANAIQVVFFLTPVFWSPAVLAKRPIFVEWNPLFHLLELTRAPLLGHVIAPHSWLFALSLAAVGLPTTLYLYRRAYARIAYWV